MRNADFGMRKKIKMNRRERGGRREFKKGIMESEKHWNNGMME